MDLEARLLGPLRLAIGGIDVTPSALRQQALLASLLLHHGRHVPVTALTTDVWGTAPPATPKEQIHTHVHRIRRRLDQATGRGTGHRTLTWEHDGYTLRLPAHHIDLTRFLTALDEARTQLSEDRPDNARTLLADALSTWRGPALAGLDSGTGLAPHVQRLEDLRIEALGLRIEADIRTGRAARTIPRLRALIDEHPYDETLHTHLVTALHTTDHPLEALHVLEKFGDALEAAHGTGLPPRLRALHSAIKNDAKAPAVPAPVTATPPRPATTPDPPAPSRSSPPSPDAPPAHQDSVRFTVLGPVRAWRGTTPLAAGSPQQRALLAILLLRGGRAATRPNSSTPSGATNHRTPPSRHCARTPHASANHSERTRT
nr:BTAD domain-containing putative transcriptional regulator [Streptomyces monomycini]